MANFGTAVFTATLNASQLVAGAATAQGALTRIGTSMSRLGGTLTTAVTLPVAVMGASLVHQSVKIEEAWNEVRATYNATPDEIERIIKPTGELGKAVTDLSLKYGLQRDVVVQQLATLSQMGFTGKKATDTLAQGLEFAVAVGLKLEDGLNLATAITNTFGLSGQELTKTLRGLNNVENETAAGGFDLMKALTRAGGAAQSMTGTAFTSRDAVASLAAGMAVLKANGQETARSADALRAIFQRIYSPTKQVQALFDKMGVSLADAQGNIRPFPGLLSDIAANFDKLNQQEQLQFTKKSIGVEFGPLFQTLIQDQQKAAQGQSIYNNALKTFGDEAKGAQAYAHELEVRQDSLKVALGRVGAAWGLLADTLRPIVAQILKPIAEFLAKVAEKMNDMSPGTQKTIVVMLGLVAVLGPVLAIVGALVAGIAAISGPVLIVIGAIAGLVAILTAMWNMGGKVGEIVRGVLKSAMDDIKKAFDNWKDAVSALMPALKILGAILGGVLLIAIKVISSAILGWSYVFKGIATAVGWFVGIIIDFFAWLYDVLVGHSIIPDLVDAIILYFKLLADILITIVKVLVDVVITVFNVLKAVVIAIWNVIVDVFKAVWNIIMVVFKTSLDTIMTVWNAVWNLIVTVFQAVWNIIVTAVTGFMNVVMTVIQSVMDIIKAIWDAVWNSIVLVAQTIWNLIMLTIQTVMDVIKGIISAVMAVLRGDWEGAWDAIKGVAETVWNAIKAAISMVWNAIQGLIKIGLDFISSVWNSVWNVIKSVAQAVWNNIIAVLTGAWNIIKSVFNGAIDIIKSVVSGLWQTAQAIFEGGINVISSIWNNFWNGLKRVVSSVVDGIMGIVDDLVGGFKRAMGTIGGILDKISSGAEKVGGVLGFNSGGLVPGTGNKDTVPSMLTPGEFVVTKQAVRRIGVANLQRLNSTSGGTEVLTPQSSPSAPAGAFQDRLAGSMSSIIQRRQVTAGTMGAPMGGTFDAGASVESDVNQSTYVFQTTVNNPVAEKASDSVQRKVTRVAEMGLFATRSGV